jgi:metallo-beta-lactamase class B
MQSAWKTIWLLIPILIGLNSTAQRRTTFQPKKVYRSNELTILQISANAYIHISYHPTTDFGKVPCNGLVYRNQQEVIVFDTPANDTSAALLIRWIKRKLHCSIKAVVPTHFHYDCLGGLQAFHNQQIPSYAHNPTIALARDNKYTIPQHGFTDSLVLTIGTEPVLVKFWGEGHTRDNVIGYIPSEKLMFGGCLIKELDASKGFLGDANITAWPATVESIKAAYPDLQWVVPGHGEYGNASLLDYTIQLFRQP